MGAFLVFLIDRFVFRISNFLRHWYVISFQIYANYIISILEQMDRFFALKISYKYLFSPLYGDRSILGYFFGFIFRLARIFSGGVFYVIFTAAAAALFLVWAAVPLFIIYKIVEYSPAFGLLGLK